MATKTIKVDDPEEAAALKAAHPDWDVQNPVLDDPNHQSTGIEFTATPHKISDAFGKGAGAASSVGDQFSGGPSSSGAGKSYDPDNMIRTYLPGIANNPQQMQAVRQALKQYEKGSGADYHTQLNTLVSQFPQLQQYTPMGKAFPAQAPGQLSAENMKALTEWTAAYQKPLTEAMQNDTNTVMSALQGLAPKLPASYQNLIKTQGMGLQNMGKEISTLIAQAQPGAIANAYSNYYNSGSGTGSATTLSPQALAQFAQGTQNK